jgi:hypothetical protein
MSLKDIIRKVFSFSGKKAKDVPLESAAPVDLSPYAKLLEAELVSASSPSSGSAEVKDVFLLDNLTSWPLSTVGLFFPGQGVAVLRDPYRGTVGRLVHWSLDGKSYPLYGDWLGSGTESIGFYHQPSRYFFLWGDEQNNQPDIEFPFGPQDSNWVPIIGDWDGDGKHGVGFYDPGRGVFMLRNQLSAPALPEIEFPFGSNAAKWLPVSGDWNGDGKDGIGLFDPETVTFYLRDDLSSGSPDYEVQLESVGANCMPLAGDWDGDGIDGIGCYDPGSGYFHLRNTLTNGKPEIAFTFGPRETSGIPFAGQWLFSQAKHVVVGAPVDEIER